jgi:hypothetical protein
MTHRPDRTTPEPADLLGMLWRATLIGATALAGWTTLSAGRTGSLTETLAAAAVTLAVVGILLASALIARGRGRE